MASFYAVLSQRGYCAFAQFVIGNRSNELRVMYNADGVMNVAYLKHEFGGFAVHLVLKK